MKKLLFSLCILASTPLCALLSPLSQSVREINAILGSKELSSNFSQNDTIYEIEREGNNYVLKTEDREMLVELIYVPPQKVGPREFKLIFHPAKPLQK